MNPSQIGGGVSKAHFNALKKRVDSFLRVYGRNLGSAARFLRVRTTDNTPVDVPLVSIDPNTEEAAWIFLVGGAFNELDTTADNSRDVLHGLASADGAGNIALVETGLLTTNVGQTSIAIVHAGGGVIAARFTGDAADPCNFDVFVLVRQIQ